MNDLIKELTTLSTTIQTPLDYKSILIKHNKGFFLKKIFKNYTDFTNQCVVLDLLERHIKGRISYLDKTFANKIEKEIETASMKLDRIYKLLNKYLPHSHDNNLRKTEKNLENIPYIIKQYEEVKHSYVNDLLHNKEIDDPNLADKNIFIYTGELNNNFSSVSVYPIVYYPNTKTIRFLLNYGTSYSSEWTTTDKINEGSFTKAIIYLESLERITKSKVEQIKKKIHEEYRTAKKTYEHNKEEAQSTFILEVTKLFVAEENFFNYKDNNEKLLKTYYTIKHDLVSLVDRFNHVKEKYLDSIEIDTLYNESICLDEKVKDNAIEFYQSYDEYNSIIEGIQILITEIEHAKKLEGQILTDTIE